MASLDGRAGDRQRLADIRRQVEYYFSDTNLANDAFFRDLVLAGSGGWVDVDTSVLQCRRIQQMQVERTELAGAIHSSAELEADAEIDAVGVCRKCWVRRRRPFELSSGAHGTTTRGGHSQSHGKGKGTGKGKGKELGRTLEYDPSTPCGYYLAGYCRHGNRCQKQHSIPYASAVRHEWLHPSDACAKESLQQCAREILGDEADALFPRVYSHLLGAAAPERSKAKANRWSRTSAASNDEDGFVWQEDPAKRDAPASPCQSGRGSVSSASPRYLLVLDLEGKDEIIEFPVLAIDVGTRRELGRFQRYVRPMQLFQGLEQTPNAPSIEFPMVLDEFDQWLRKTLGHGLYDEKFGHTTAFVTCGDWDCKHIHTQCRICKIRVPEAFRQWVNIKRTYTDIFGGEFRGMKSMLSRLGLLDPQGGVVHGFHHLGMHDVENIGRCLLHLLDRGFVVNINGWKS